MRFLRVLTVCLAAALCAARFEARQSGGDNHVESENDGRVDASTLSAAICPIVYPVDQSPSERGFHYIFYGNAFFINREGYLLTAAHVLSQLTDAQPSIVLRLPNAPPRLLKVTLVARDLDHDVALLRATPNPFEGKYGVRFLSLAIERPGPEAVVLGSALRPSRLKDPHTFDAFAEDRPEGRVLSYEFSQLDRGAADTELLLFGHEVLKGDSGAPVVAAGAERAAVGFVEGQWLGFGGPRGITSAKMGVTGIAAAVPIHYAIALLEREGVRWHAMPEAATERSDASFMTPQVPAPLSLVGAPYPAQALTGGDVRLDARVEANGQLADVRLIRGAPVFAEKAQAAIASWTFRAASGERTAAVARIGIVFEFLPPSGERPVAAPVDRQPLSSEHAAVFLDTASAASLPPLAGNEALIAGLRIAADGRVDSVKILQGPSLSPAGDSEIRAWRFSPGEFAGRKCDSLVVVVFVGSGRAPSHARAAACQPACAP